MKRIVNIAKNHHEAEEWDVRQHIQMSHEERQEVAKTLKKRVYGEHCPDICETQKAGR